MCVPPSTIRALQASKFLEIAYKLNIGQLLKAFNWPCGPMDKASAHGVGDCRFESYQGHGVCLPGSVSYGILMLFLVPNKCDYF